MSVERIEDWLGWGWSDTTSSTECPRCWAKPGEVCRRPSGRKTMGGVPHYEREEKFYRDFPHYNTTIRRGSTMENTLDA